MNVSFDQNLLTVDTRKFVFVQKSNARCIDCGLDGEYRSPDDTCRAPCQYYERADKRNGLWKETEDG